MNWRRITPLISKDILLFAHDKLFAFLTAFCLILFIMIYYILPKTVKETIKIGYYSPSPHVVTGTAKEAPGISIQNVNSDERLKQAVVDKKFHIGISVSGEILKPSDPGKNTQVRLYYSSEIPDEIMETYTIILDEMINRMSGHAAKFNFAETVLGPDMAGKQIPFRDRILPLLVFFMLITGTFILANLITDELENKTMQALLSTPMQVTDVFAGKAVVGVLLSFSQALLMITATGRLAQNPLIITSAMFLGAIMVTGMAFLIASVAKDVMSVVAWGTLVVMILSIPAVTILFPGPVPGWIKAIPSFFIVDTLHRAVNFKTEIGWSGHLDNFSLMIAFSIAFIFLGILTLKRKVKCTLEE